MEKLVNGIIDFQNGDFKSREALFAELANGQSPEVLFITCADSRIDPGLITQTEPGELFVCRNAGNIVPPHAKISGGTVASIEYAVAVLGVKHIVVCGHTDCGAMKGALNPKGLDALPHVQNWLEHSRGAVEVVEAKRGKATADELLMVIEENVLLQLQHLRTHPAVASALAAGEVELHGWVYHIGNGMVTCHDESADAFVDLEQRYAEYVKKSEAA